MISSILTHVLLFLFTFGLSRIYTKHLSSFWGPLLTNGTIINDRIISIINRYNIGVTVSIDGSKNVHDYLRIYKNGNGTFDKIKKNIKYLISHTKVKISYEATYTKEHISAGIGINDIKRIIKNEFKISNGVVVTVMKSKLTVTDNDNIYFSEKELERIIDTKIQNINIRNIENLLNDDAILPIIRSIFDKTFTEYICPVAETIFSVDSNGEIYPCQLFHRDIYRIGNVNNIDFNSIDANMRGVKHELSELNKLNSKRCESCWARYICTHCPGKYWYMSNEKTKNFYCRITKKYIEKTIIELSRVTTDIDLFTEIKNKYRKKANESELCY